MTDRTPRALDDARFHALVDALQAGEALPDDLSPEDEADLKLAAQLFAAQAPLPEIMAERQWRDEPAHNAVPSRSTAPGRAAPRPVRRFRWLPEAALLVLILVVAGIVWLGRPGAGPVRSGDGTPSVPVATPVSGIQLPPGPFTALDIDGDSAYVGISDSVARFDVTDPSAPRLAAVSEPLVKPDQEAVKKLYIWDIAADGTAVYAAAGSAGIQVYDASDPARLSWMSALSETQSAAYPGPITMATFQLEAAGRVYAAEESGQSTVLSTYRASDMPPVLHWSATTIVPDMTLDLAVAGNRLIRNGREGLTIHELNDNDVSRLLGSAPMGLGLFVSQPSRVRVDGDVAFVTRIEELMPFDTVPSPPVTAEDSPANVPVVGVRIYDIGGPAAPRLIGTLQLEQRPEAMAIHDGTLFLTTDSGQQSSQLWSYDVSDPANPQSLGGPLDIADDMIGLASKGQYLLALLTNDGLRSLDISDPSAPKWVDPPTPVDSQAPDQTVTPSVVITPSLQAPMAIPGSWSPDSRWLAMWVAGAEPGVDGFLRFLDTQTGRTCDHEDVRNGNMYEAASITWDGPTTFVLDRDVGGFRGEPCGPVEVLPEGRRIPWQIVSPEGRLVAETRFTSPTAVDGSSLVTTLKAPGSGLTIPSRTWSAPSYAVMEPLGTWLPDDSFLIHQSDAGPLRMHLDGTVTEVFTETFRAPSAEAPGDVVVRALAEHPEDDPHLLMIANVGPDLLFHPESGEIEQLSKTNILSLRGHWPAGWIPTLDTGNGDLVSARRLDPAGAPPVTPTGPARFVDFAPSGDRVAFRNPDTGRLELRAFPSWALLGEWTLEAGADADEGFDITWSPDGRTLAAYRGTHGNEPSTSVFLIRDVPQAPDPTSPTE